MKSVNSETLRVSAGEIDGYLYDDLNNDHRLSDNVLITLNDIRGVTDLKKEFCGPSQFISDGRTVQIEIQHKALLNVANRQLNPMMYFVMLMISLHNMS